jgi:glutathione S-transferase
MILYWSARSPYVRKVMVCAHELGIQDTIKRVHRVASADGSYAEFAKINPVGQIPAMVLDDGTVIPNSTVICDYLATNFGGATILPASGPGRLDVMRRYGFGEGVIDKAIRWVSENLRPKELKSEKIAGACRQSVQQTLDLLEREVHCWPTQRFDLGDIAVCCGLGYLDFRHPRLDWRSARPELAKYYARHAARPSMKATPSPSPLEEQGAPATSTLNHAGS